MYIKGMVQVQGTTYRVARLNAGTYEIVRICDEVTAGRFSCVPRLQVTALAVDEQLMKQLATTAVQRGRTTWIGRASSA
jgi:hypothetical protein